MWAIGLCVLHFGCGRAGLQSDSLNPGDVTTAAEPCAEQSCSGHGFCVLVTSKAGRCFCDTGFVNDGPLGCRSAGCQADADCPTTEACAPGRCDTDLGCIYPALADGSPCGEGRCFGLSLNQSSCLQGACVGETVILDCNDNDPCSNDMCTPDQGCQHEEICQAQGWYGLAASDLAPRAQRIEPASDWGGGISRSRTESGGPSVAVDSQGRVVVLWIEALSQGHRIYLRRWQGLQWEALAGSASADGIGAISAPSTVGALPALAIDLADRPVVAWQQEIDGSTSAIYLRRWDGAAWGELDGSARAFGIGQRSGRATAPDVAINGDGMPVVAWSDEIDGARQVLVRRYNGTLWEGLAGSEGNRGISDSITESTSPALAIGPGGQPVVTWIEKHTPGEPSIYLKAFDGTVWAEAGGSASGVGISGAGVKSQRRLSLAVDAQSHYIVAWEEFQGVGTARPLGRLEYWDGATWGPLGDNSTVFGQSTAGQYSLRVVVSAGGDITLLWKTEPTRLLRLNQWRSGVWQEVGGSLAPGGLVEFQSVAVSTPGSLALDGSGHAVVVWSDDADGQRNNTSGPRGDFNIYLRRYDGQRWHAEGGDASSGGGGLGLAGFDARRPTVIMDASAQPVVAWNQGHTGANDDSSVYVRRLQGDTWQEMAGSASGQGVATRLGANIFTTSELSAAGAGAPSLAWEIGGALLVRSWGGSSWDDIGGSSTSPGVLPSTLGCGRFSTAHAATGELSVTCNVDVGSNQATQVRTYDGSWGGLASSDLGDGLAPNGNRFAPDLAWDSQGRLVVAWTTGGFSGNAIQVSRWDGNAWNALGSSLDSEGISGSNLTSTAPRLAMDTLDRPVVAWVESIGAATEIYLKRWQAGAWQSLAGSAQGDGLSTSRSKAEAVDVAIDSNDEPVVVWQDGRSGQWEIYLRRFDGSAWVELDASATDGGISNSASGSLAPRLAVSGGLICVTWEEPSGRGQRVVLRCHRD